MCTLPSFEKTLSFQLDWASQAGRLWIAASDPRIRSDLLRVQTDVWSLLSVVDTQSEALIMLLPTASMLEATFRWNASPCMPLNWEDICGPSSIPTLIHVHPPNSKDVGTWRLQSEASRDPRAQSGSLPAMPGNHAASNTWHRQLTGSIERKNAGGSGVYEIRKRRQRYGRRIGHGRRFGQGRQWSGQGQQQEDIACRSCSRRSCFGERGAE